MEFIKGTQIAYVPTHANGDLKHKDVQFGFIMRVVRRKDTKEDLFFCRYWTSDLKELRTKANSELTPAYLLVKHDSVDKKQVSKAMEAITMAELGF